MNNDAVKELLNAVGALAEMSLNFYRAAINSGATREEACVLVQSLISACIYGKREDGHEEPSPYLHRCHSTDQGQP